jgi:hypothetical protein
MYEILIKIAIWRNAYVGLFANKNNPMSLNDISDWMILL